MERESAQLIQCLERITAELQEIKGQLTEIREQGAAIAEGVRHWDGTRLSSPAGAGSESAISDPVEAERSLGTLQEGADAAGLREAVQTKHPKVVEKGKRRVGVIAANVLFYLCMLLLIVGAVAFSQSTDPEKSLFGFRYYYIKTASMEPVLPVGSVVITKSVPSEEIQVGDDITVYVGDGSSDSYLTHRVVELTTDQSGELAFLTKGVNNKANDPAPFNAKLVVGRVVFCIPKLGVVMTFVQSQLILVIGIFVLLLALSFMLRLLFSKEPKTEGDPNHSGNTAGSKPSGLTGRKKRKKEVSPSPEAKDGTLEEREEEARV